MASSSIREMFMAAGKQLGNWKKVTI
jgi:hypothetical protein